MGKYEEIKKARQILGLYEFATLKDIKTRYKELIKEWHPDLCKENEEISKEKTIEIINAFKTIASNLNYFSHPTSLTVGAKETAEGKITDEAVLKRINKIASEIIKWGKKFRK